MSERQAIPNSSQVRTERMGRGAIEHAREHADAIL